MRVNSAGVCSTQARIATNVSGEFYDVTSFADESIFVTGATWEFYIGGLQNHPFLIKADKQLNPQWSNTYVSADTTWISFDKIYKLKDNNILVVGQSDVSGNSKMLIAKMDSAGVIL